jgi:hypothetical protein
MIEHKELEQRILAELEEAGEETVGTLINTVTQSAGAPAELNSCFAAIGSLIDRDFVRMSNSRGADRRLEPLPQQDSLVVLDSLALKFKYDPVKGYWQDNSIIAGEPLREYPPEVILTKTGRAASVAVLTERGYQWWRAKT